MKSSVAVKTNSKHGVCRVGVSALKRDIFGLDCWYIMPSDKDTAESEEPYYDCISEKTEVIRESITLKKKELALLQNLDRDVGEIDRDVGAANLSVNGNVVEVTATVHGHPTELKELIAAYHWSEHTVDYESPPEGSSDGQFSWKLRGSLGAMANKMRTAE